MRHRVVLVCALPFLLVSCITIVIAPTPTAETKAALPTYELQAQSTALPARAVTPTRAQLQTLTAECVAWREARAYVGKSNCVTGTVTRVFTDPRSQVTFIDFSSERTAYIGFSPRIIWDASWVGKCVKIFGAIVLYNDRPETVINSRDQVVLC